MDNLSEISDYYRHWDYAVFGRDNDTKIIFIDRTNRFMSRLFSDCVKLYMNETLTISTNQQCPRHCLICDNKTTVIYCHNCESLMRGKLSKLHKLPKIVDIWEPEKLSYGILVFSLSTERQCLILTRELYYDIGCEINDEFVNKYLIGYCDVSQTNGVVAKEYIRRRLSNKAIIMREYCIEHGSADIFTLIIGTLIKCEYVIAQS